MLMELLISARAGTVTLGFGAATFGDEGQSTISPDRGRGLDLIFEACSTLTDFVRCGAGMRAAMW